MCVITKQLFNTEAKAFEAYAHSLWKARMKTKLELEAKVAELTKEFDAACEHIKELV